MRTLSSEAALGNIRNNPMSVWCGNDADTAGANQNYAGNRVKQEFLPVAVTKKFDIAEGDSVYAMGSCFAREIEAAFGRGGFDVLSFKSEDFSEEDFRSPHSWGASNFLNRYNTASMLAEVERVLGVRDIADDKLVYGPADRLMDLHFGNSCEPGDLALIAKRRQITKTVGSRLARANIVVFTLGLTEAWYDNEGEGYINSAVDLHILRRNKDRFELRLLNFQENLANLEQIYAHVRAVNPGAKIVVTVSPVPLQATFTEHDVVIANLNSKATLRAVAAEFCANHDDVLYFPSYEIVSYSDQSSAWKGDRRHVTTRMVDFIINTFRAAHGLDTGQPREPLLLPSVEDNKIELLDGMTHGFEIVGDEVALHPFDGPIGRLAEVNFKIGALGLHGFQSGVQVAHTACETIEFGVRAYRAGTREMLGEAYVQVDAGAADTLSLGLDPATNEPVDISLFTRMSRADSSSANAWARFLGPKVVYAP